MKFIGRFDELLDTGRGMYFESINKTAVLELKHGCHETVAGIQLKPTINYLRFKNFINPQNNRNENRLWNYKVRKEVCILIK